MQIVYLSARPAVLAETWRHVQTHMSWITRALVVAPASMLHDFALDGDVTYISDEELSGRPTAQITALDHTSRNTWLRHRLGECDAVEQTFVMSDDDYRPLRTVGSDFYIDAEGRHRLYYFYDLADWPGRSTSYDAAQHLTFEMLRFVGAPHLAFGAHMPQIIHKDLFARAFETARTVTDKFLLCEWSVYGNIALRADRHRFADPQPFETMCWPQFIHEWEWWITPTGYAFENFYPELYEPGGLFAGLSTEVTGDPAESTRAAFEKVDRWTEFGRRTERFDFGNDIANPWTKQSALRRAYFATLRRLIPLRRHLHL